MKIGLFSQPHDSQTSALQDYINSIAPGVCQHFTVPVHGSPPVALDRSGVYWDSVNVAELDLAYVHGFSYANPVIPPSRDNLDWTVWQVDYISEQQKSSFMFSAFEEMERRGVRLFNPPRIHVQNFLKVDLLGELRGAGFQVPKMVCTNDREVVQAFGHDVEQPIWRPVTGRAAWQAFGDKQRELLVSTRATPILLAEIIDGPLIRSYLIDGQPLLCLQNSAPALTPLERLEVFQEFECSEVHGELRRLAEITGLRWGQVLFVLKDDQIWVYDVDADPIFDWLPEVYQRKLGEGLAQRFLGHDIATGTEVSDTAHLRPTPFLRRMLRILFELEYRKYH